VNSAADGITSDAINNCSIDHICNMNTSTTNDTSAARHGDVVRLNIAGY